MGTPLYTKALPSSILQGFLQLTPRASFLLAISGGRDSMLLLHIFRELQREGYVAAPRVFHLDHCLRPDSHIDAEFVQDFCAQQKLGCTVKQRQVAVYARRLGRSLEETGRLLRYRLLAKQLQAQPLCDAIVTAHHADDYLESVLMSLIRGGGAAAFGTLPYWSYLPIAKYKFALLRPLMHLSREFIDAAVQEYHIPYREDASNQSRSFLRNRLRMQVLPLLKQEGLSTAKLWQNFHLASPLRTNPKKTASNVSPDSGYAPSILPGSSSASSERFHTSDLGYASPEFFQNVDLNLDTKRKGKARGLIVMPEYLSLDRRLFQDLRSLKPLFDMAFRSLGLYPAKHTCIQEIHRQIRVHGGSAFRIYYVSKDFCIYADRRGPAWIFKLSAALFRSYRSRECSAKELEAQASVLDTKERRAAYRALQVYIREEERLHGHSKLIQLSYNHRSKYLCLKQNERLCTFRAGMRFAFKDKLQSAPHTKKLKKLFQELAIPLPVRAHVPLVYNQATNQVTAALFSFWESSSDCYFA